MALLAIAESDPRKPSFSKQWATGLGSPISSALASLSLPALLNVLIANCPQLMLSITYVSYNSLFTCLVISREWLSYASERKGLRTSVPEGAQRSTFWLNLPYRYSLPLLVASGLLHWLLSQSIFLTQVNVMDANGKPAMANISTVGWSSLSLTLLLLLGGIMILTVFGFGFKRYPSSGMPIASICSRAISAACHPKPGQYDEATKRLQYGVMGKSDDGREFVGFSSTNVEPLVQGNLYY